MEISLKELQQQLEELETEIDLTLEDIKLTTREPENQRTLDILDKELTRLTNKANGIKLMIGHHNSLNGESVRVGVGQSYLI